MPGQRGMWGPDPWLHGGLPWGRALPPLRLGPALLSIQENGLQPETPLSQGYIDRMQAYIPSQAE